MIFDTSEGDDPGMDSKGFPSLPSKSLSGELKGFSTPPRVAVPIRDTPSPVLTTEQLYEKALWKDEEGQPRKIFSLNFDQAAFDNVDQISDDEENFDELSPKVCAEKIRANFDDVKDRFVRLSLAVDILGGEDDSENSADVSGAMSPRKPKGLEDIPTTLEDIYQLSNRNRKHKKKKVKSQDNSASSHSSDSTPNPKEKKEKPEPEVEGKHQGDSFESTIDFMRGIGWITEEAPSRPARAQPAAKKSTVNSNVLHPQKLATRGRGQPHSNQGRGDRRNQSSHGHYNPHSGQVPPQFVHPQSYNGYGYPGPMPGAGYQMHYPSQYFMVPPGYPVMAGEGGPQRGHFQK